MSRKNLLEIKDLTVQFTFNKKKLIAINNISLYIKDREIVGLVGESGSGKSMTALSIINLIPFPGRIKTGEVYVKGIEQNLLELTEKEIVKVRGKKISVIFQDPLSSLNPCFTIGWQLNEVLSSGGSKLGKKDKKERIREILKKVRFKNVDEVFNSLPHQLSGGMRQRAIIAMALVLNPLLILADEPTTALDVTTQKDIFNLIEELRSNNNISFMVISHDLYLIGERCDRIYVMYAGQIVEEGLPTDIFKNPLHPYTIGLINSTPSVDNIRNRLEVIPGMIEDLTDLPASGCFFQKRCKVAFNRCFVEMPELKSIDDFRLIRCHKL